MTRPAVPGPPDPVAALRDVLASTIGLATYTATTVVGVVEQTLVYAVNGALDRLVPTIADAVISRIDINDIVRERVDLHAIVTEALDTLDLTQLVIDRVDVNEIVAQADFDAIIDRVPIVAIADYVIEEIDLPQIIRDSTSGIAGEAMDTIRKQGVGADQLVSRVADRLLLRRRQRQVDAPGEPESLMGRLKEDVDRAPGLEIGEKAP